MSSQKLEEETILTFDPVDIKEAYNLLQESMDEDFEVRNHITPRLKAAYDNKESLVEQLEKQGVDLYTFFRVSR